MFRRWFQYGETEVANNYRVSAYVKNGLKPVGAIIEDCGDCGDLAMVTAGVEDYQTPVLDDAPWYTPEEPDSADFAGVFIREVVGLEGSTTTVEVEESIGDGGIPGTRRAQSRTVAVTADVVGRTPEAAAVGIEWLSSILHPPCAEGSDCGGDTLHLFSTCPVACVGQTDQEAPMASTVYNQTPAFSGSESLSAERVLTNYLRNGSMQLGTSTTVTNWQSVSNFFFNFAEQIGSVVPPTGVGTVNRDKVMRIQLPALTPTDNGVMIVQTVPTVPGRRYAYGGWVYVPSGTGVSPYISANGILFGATEKVTAKDRWVYLSKTFTAENATTELGIGANAGVTASGSVFYADAFMLLDDTGFINTQSFSAGVSVEGWVGTDSVDLTFTAPQSISVNAIPYPDFNSVATWSASNGTLTSVTEGAENVGAYSATTAAAQQYVTHRVVPVDAGQTYTASLDLKLQVTSSAYDINILWYNGNTFLSSSGANYAAGSLSGGAYTRMTVTGTAPASANLARVQVGPSTVLPVGSGFRVDKASFTKNSAAVPFAPDGELVLQWKTALSPGTNRQAAHGLVHATRPGELHTVSFEVYVPTGSPDVQGRILFHNQGDSRVITEKDQWVPVVMTYRAASTFTRWGVATAPGQGNVGSAGRYVKIRNPRSWPGLAPQPNNYFDGSNTDLPTTNLAAGIVATATSGAITLTTGEIWNGKTWTRATAGGTSAGTARVSIPLVSLQQGVTYDASWLLANDSGAAVTVALDWADITPRTTTTIQPGEVRRVYARGLRIYDATYRFTDMELSAGDAGRNLLFADVEVRPASPYDFAWSGTVDDSTSTATPLTTAFAWTPAEGLQQGEREYLYGPILEPVCDMVEQRWVVSSTSVATVAVVWADEGGVSLLEETPVVVGASPVEVVGIEATTPGFPGNWRPTLVSIGADGTPAPLVVHSLTVVHRPVLTVEECARPYRRTMHGVVTVEGPKVVEWLTLGDVDDGSSVARVEWTWVATEPHAWHDPLPIITSAQGKANTQAYQAPGVPISAPANAPVNSTACARPAVTAVTCADNTLGPGITLPPQPPTIAESGIMNLAGSNRTRRTFEIPEDLSPLGVGKLSWTFVNDAKPKFGIRVRIYEDTDPAFVQPSECTFIEEFTVEYLGPNQTLYIDGPADDVYVRCGTDAFGQPIFATALKNVRGNYGGPFVNSLIGCGRPYFISVDIPNTYTNSPSNISGQTTGSDQGDVQWSVDLVRRA